MGLFDTLLISGSAMAAERQRADITAANLANAETTHTEDGGPFVRKEVVFRSAGPSFNAVFHRLGRFAGGAPGSVQISDVVDDTTPPVMRYEPGNPDANQDGYVAYPAINPVAEMVDLMGAMRAYQLNASAVNSSKQMIQQSIEILKTT